jgi:hypothetical protein
MNHSKVPRTILMETGTDHPHASVFVSTIVDLLKPLNESAWIYFPVVIERKEAYNSCNFESSHALSVRISIDEHTVVAWVLISPEWTCTDMFLSHATSTTQIAGSKESCGSGIEDLELAFMPRQATSWDICGITGIISAELSEQEVSNEASQVWNSNFVC